MLVGGPIAGLARARPVPPKLIAQAQVVSTGQGSNNGATNADSVLIEVAAPASGLWLEPALGVSWCAQVTRAR